MENMDILLQHPFNLAENKNEKSDTNKAWAERYKTITDGQLNIHTTPLPDGTIDPDCWSAFVPEDRDDVWRRGEQSVHPNARSKWVLANEDDVTTWFQVEIVAPVFSKFRRFGSVHHLGKSPPDRGGVIVDSRIRWGTRTIAIGEFKRNIFKPKTWIGKRLYKDKEQQRLSREIRGQEIFFVVCTVC
ncbi:uncharacterized protein FIESC28_10884 [Fusarium coffeatum]|uniref:Uncharacterized protein n=1 Tax=Fusarium coffeatum TaxID=231269 RepID=A0A366QPW4_9HYPO|nr:uncharacterized protein FIESC28_10884 [Fusarium coffeatum]RBR06913.1 hypothetical protein FIESC28_10884 [Fusarium coffeatum]